MSGLLSIRNRQRVRRLDTALLRRIALHLLRTQFPQRPFELCLHLVASKEMARVNQTFLQHEGSTDVITFNHANLNGAPGAKAAHAKNSSLHGEIYICVDDAVTQAQAFGTTWTAEIVRYAVHGLLHLEGHDDLEPSARRRMKQVENRLVQRLAQTFSFPALARHREHHAPVRRRAAKLKSPARPRARP
jgi:probable rRNA maturation factor